MLKKFLSCLLVIILSLGLAACGSSQAAWQEQYDLGVRYLSEGNYEEAILAFTTAIEIDAKQADAYIGLADAYKGKGDTDKATEILEQGFEATGSTDIEEKLAYESAMLKYDEWIIDGINLLEPNFSAFYAAFGDRPITDNNDPEHDTIVFDIDSAAPGIPIDEQGIEFYVYAHHGKEDIEQAYTYVPGHTGPRGFTIGTTTCEEVLATLPPFEMDDITYHEEGDGFVGWGPREAYLNIKFDPDNIWGFNNPSGLPYGVEWGWILDGRQCRYYVNFANGIINELGFEGRTGTEDQPNSNNAQTRNWEQPTDIELIAEQLSLLEPVETAFLANDGDTVGQLLMSEGVQNVLSSFPEQTGYRYKIDENGEWVFAYLPQKEITGLAEGKSGFYDCYQIYLYGDKMETFAFMEWSEAGFYGSTGGDPSRIINGYFDVKYFE